MKLLTISIFFTRLPISINSSCNANIESDPAAYTNIQLETYITFSVSLKSSCGDNCAKLATLSCGKN